MNHQQDVTAEKNPQETDLPSQSIASFILVLAIIAAFYLFERWLWHVRFAQGMLHPGDAPGNLGLVPGIMLVPVLLFLLFRIHACWRSEQVAGRILLFIILLFIQCGSIALGANVYGSIISMNKINLDNFTMNSVHKALDLYSLSTGSYPTSLKLMLPNYLRSIPTSSFGRNLPVQYLNFSDASDSKKSKWVLWMPGPNAKFDIVDGQEMREAMVELNSGKLSPWLDERLFRWGTDSGQRDVMISSLADFLDQSTVNQVKEALDAYHEKHGSYPGGLKSLVPEQLPHGIPKTGLHACYDYNIDYKAAYRYGQKEPCEAWLLYLPARKQLNTSDMDKAVAQLNRSEFQPWLCDLIFDPSNGTTSDGAYIRLGMRKAASQPEMQKH